MVFNSLRDAANSPALPAIVDVAFKYEAAMVLYRDISY